MSPNDPSVSDPTQAEVDAVRRFNRFYTRRIGVLDEKLMHSPFTLTQMRVLWELAHEGEQTALALRGALGLDAGYLSRILGGFEKGGLAERRPDPADGRQALVRLTEAGRTALAPWENVSSREVAAMIALLGEPERVALTAAMARIERLFGDGRVSSAPVLRAHRPGDMGWIVGRQSALYTAEFGWNDEYEALASEIVAQFLREYDPERERCWIAEIEGEPVGAIMLKRQSDETAKLRLLHVEPIARRRGVGRQLVGECVETARRFGYGEIVLWTQSMLEDAQRLYQGFGFEQTDEEPHHSFGCDLIGRNWRLAL